jgi:quercetin dioxygenase-like cupin family protein
MILDTKTILLILCFTALFTGMSVYSQEISVVPKHEEEIAQRLAADGPKETKGIESSTILGAVSLDDEFENLDGHILRARIVTVLPGGVVGVHQHESRPGMAYILEGQLTEYRNDETEPKTRSEGAASFEKTGVIHWWINESPNKAKVLVVDIVSEESK